MSTRKITVCQRIEHKRADRLGQPLKFASEEAKKTSVQFKSYVNKKKNS